MKVLVNPWKDEFLELVRASKRSIKISSPFVKLGVCQEMLKLKQPSAKVELITAFQMPSVVGGSLDIPALEKIIQEGGIVRNASGLHAKIYLFDEAKAIVTSGNLTYGGLVKNRECGIFLSEKKMVQQVSSEFNLISAESDILSIARIQAAQKILTSIPKKTPLHIPAKENPDFPDAINAPLENATDAIRSQLSGWKRDVFESVDTIKTSEFSLEEVYAFETIFYNKHPNNNNVRDKIRQQLQYLRDIGLVEFIGLGKYRKLWK